MMPFKCYGKLCGQLEDFCHGEHGSKFVIRRLLEGVEPERELLKAELGLNNPGNMLRLIQERIIL